MKKIKKVKAELQGINYVREQDVKESNWSWKGLMI
jgi:hypothetical protein